jgi:uncharacterized membrane protein
MPTESEPAAPESARPVARVVERNVSGLVAARQEAERARGFQERMADAITAFSGSMPFVYLHILWFGGWILWNVGLGRSQPFDPYPFGMLTTIVSLEAIFLSTFVLITQNRQAKVADRRADLDVQVNLLAEHEITRLLRLTDVIAKHLGIDTKDVAELQELKRDVQPHDVLQKLDDLDGSAKQPSSKSPN